MSTSYACQLKKQHRETIICDSQLADPNSVVYSPKFSPKPEVLAREQVLNTPCCNLLTFAVED